MTCVTAVPATQEVVRTSHINIRWCCSFDEVCQEGQLLQDDLVLDVHCHFYCTTHQAHNTVKHLRDLAEHFRSEIPCFCKKRTDPWCTFRASGYHADLVAVKDQYTVLKLLLIPPHLDPKSLSESRLVSGYMLCGI